MINMSFVLVEHVVCIKRSVKGMRSIVPYQLLVNLHLTMIKPYFTYFDIIWGQFNETLKNKLSETAVVLLKGINLSVGQKSFSVSGSKR